AINYHHLPQQSDDEVISLLTEVTGIGRWTAEIYCLFSLGRPDVFAANDLALQAATQDLFNLSERPKERAMRILAKQWAPYRSSAAYLLWSHYSRVKNRTGINV
ncbi:MAG: DNA-3-methyladenine glycosylase family protein, partial [Ostreibacterium sp.]